MPYCRHCRGWECRWGNKCRSAQRDAELGSAGGRMRHRTRVATLDDESVARHEERLIRGSDHDPNAAAIARSLMLLEAYRVEHRGQDPTFEGESYERWVRGREELRLKALFENEDREIARELAASRARREQKILEAERCLGLREDDS